MASTSPTDAVKEKFVLEEEFDTKHGTVEIMQDGMPLNASGHRDQLKRQYGLLGLCGLALNIDNAWIALGGSVTISIGRLRVCLWTLCMLTVQ
jgi:hypothetical protein